LNNRKNASNITKKRKFQRAIIPIRKKNALLKKETSFLEKKGGEVLA